MKVQAMDYPSVPTSDVFQAWEPCVFNRVYVVPPTEDDGLQPKGLRVQRWPSAYEVFEKHG